MYHGCVSTRTTRRRNIALQGFVQAESRDISVLLCLLGSMPGYGVTESVKSHLLKFGEIKLVMDV